MYNRTHGSTLERIFLYDCWVPKPGFGINRLNGKLEETDIIKRSVRKPEQFWERTQLPANWNERRKIEKKRQLHDEDYVDEQLERFRIQEWNRRFKGVWFYNNGEPVYVTGAHYFYMNWWHLDTGYPEYRNADRKRYYVQQFCIEDPLSAGMVDVSNRRSGKSYRAGAFLYDDISMSLDCNGGLQSKTDLDAKNLFKGKIVTPFRRLPDFFRPEIDDRTGTNPEKELRFIKSPRKGKKAVDDIGELGLNSFINFLASEKFAYDGWKLLRYVGDEVGKTEECSVYERWQVVKYCLRIGKKWVGKALLTSTVEFIDTEKGDFEKIWIESNPEKRDKNGHTLSGLYKYFTPAYEVYEVDKYGNADEEAGKTFYLNTREGLAENPKALEAEIRKNPFTEDELFRANAEGCLYNSIKLNNRISYLSWNQQLVERGNFVWEGVPDQSKVLWMPSKNGRWAKCWLPEDNNQIKWEGNLCYPLDILRFTSGCDPFDHDSTEDNRNSKGSSSVKRRRAKENDPFTNCHICYYLHRQPIADLFYEDMIMQCVFFGCQILVESNKIGIIRHFRKRRYGPFLLHLPQYKEPGIPATLDNKKDASLMAEAHIEQYIDRMFFLDQCKQALKFDIKNTEKSDAWMAFLWSEYSDNFRYIEVEDDTGMIEVGSLFREYELDPELN
jgi:hypothetical protein